MSLNDHLIDAIESKDQTKLGILLQNVSRNEVNAKVGLKLMTPLHYACSNNNYQAVEKLLQVDGVDVNLRDYIGFTPVMRAAYHSSNEALQIIVRDIKVDLGARNNDGWGLEDVVGIYHSTTQQISPLLSIIGEEREKRRTEGSGQCVGIMAKRRSTDSYLEVYNRKYPHLSNTPSSG